MGMHLADAEQLVIQDFQGVGPRDAGKFDFFAESIQAGDDPLELCRGPGAVGNPAVFGDIADGKNLLPAGLQGIGHHDPLVDLEVRPAQEIGVRSDSCRDDHQFGRYAFTAFQNDAPDPIIAVDLGDADIGANADPEVGGVPGKQVAGGLVELLGHQPAETLQQGDARAAPRQGAGGLQSQDAAADNGARQSRSALSENGVSIPQGAQDGHAFPVDPGDGRHEGMGSHGQDQAVIGQNLIVRQGQSPAVRVKVPQFGSQPQVDAVFPIPFFRVDEQAAGSNLAGEVAGQVETEIGEVGLLAQQGNAGRRGVPAG